MFAVIVWGLHTTLPVGLLSHARAALETLLQGGIQQEIDVPLHRYIYISRTLCLYLHNDNSSVDHNLPHWLTQYPQTPKEC